MNRQLGFFTFAASVIAAFLVFQITTGCGRQNLLPGNPSAFLQGRGAYYRGDYTTAQSFFNQVTAEGSGASLDERKQARVFTTRLQLAQAGSDLVSTIQNTLGNFDLSGSGTQDVGSLQRQLVSTVEATRAQVRAAADSINQLVRSGDVSSQDAIATEVALVNAQAAAATLTDAFNNTTANPNSDGDGVLEASDVEGLSGQQVAQLWQAANAGSTESGASGGITQYLQTTLDFGGGASGEQISINSGSIGATNESVSDLNRRMLNGEIDGDELATFLGGSGGN